MDKSLENLLTRCLEQMDAGQSIEEILARYPNDAPRLRPLLETVSTVENMPLAPTIAARRKSKQRFLEEAAALRATPPRPRAGLIAHFARSWAPAMAVALLIIGAIWIVRPRDVNPVPGTSFDSATTPSERITPSPSATTTQPPITTKEIEVEGDDFRPVQAHDPLEIGIDSTKTPTATVAAPPSANVTRSITTDLEDTANEQGGLEDSGADDQGNTGDSTSGTGSDSSGTDSGDSSGGSDDGSHETDDSSHDDPADDSDHDSGSEDDSSHDSDSDNEEEHDNTESDASHSGSDGSGSTESESGH